MNSKIERIKEMADELRTMFPNLSVTLSVDKFGEVELCCPSHHDYQSASEWMRELGVGIRNKVPQNGFTRITGESCGVKVKALPDGLPPTCHKEKYIEKIPVEKTVQTGEFIEVERERIVCTGAEGGAK